jgi:putative ABC transport system permease protein
MLTQIILESWTALKRNRTRTALTMAGIVWGIVTVTLLIAYGSSFRNVLVSGFDAFGKSVVVAWPQQTSEQPGGQRAGKVVVFEQADLDMVKETAPLVKFVCRETVHRPGISYGDRMVGTAAIRGVCPEYGEMRNEVPSEGRWLNASDELERRRVWPYQRKALQRPAGGRRTGRDWGRALHRHRCDGAKNPAKQLFFE